MNKITLSTGEPGRHWSNGVEKQKDRTRWNIGGGPPLTADEFAAALNAQSLARDAAERLKTQTRPTGGEQVETPLNDPQKAMSIGDVVPLVWCRRRTVGGVTRGGVLVFPPATEARFSNDATTVSASYHCVLGLGRMGAVQVWQVRNGACRIGSFTQNYDQRAGAWAPGNFATTQSSYTVPTFPLATGGGGDYSGVSTIAFSATFSAGSDDWKTGWNVFVTDGHIVERGRILDNVVGSSDNVVDLYLFARQRSGRLPDAMFDFDSLLLAAKFLETNQLFCNAVFNTQADTKEFLDGLLRLFLLREIRVNGKFGLEPLVPVDSEGVILDDIQNPDWRLSSNIIKTMTEETPDNSSRKDLPIVVTWRQQATATDLPFARTLYCTSTGNGITGSDTQESLEAIDLSQYCDSERHAAKVGAYWHARYTLIDHNATAELLPGTQTGELRAGQTAQVLLPLVTNVEPAGVINKFYTIETVGISTDGSELVTMSHLPVDAAGRSRLAMAILAANPPGLILPHPAIGVCDVPGRATDTTVPAQTINSSVVPFSRGGSGAFVGGGGGGAPSNGSGQGGTGDFSAPAAGAGSIGGRSVGNDTPTNAEGKQARRKDDSGGWPPFGPYYTTRCTDGKPEQGYVAKLTTWNGQSVKEPSPYAYGYVNISYKKGTLTVVPETVPTDTTGPGWYRLSYETPNGTKVKNLLHFAWPLVMQNITILCASGPENIKQHIVTPGQKNLWDIGKIYSPGINIDDNLRQLNPQFQNPDILFPGNWVNIPQTD